MRKLFDKLLGRGRDRAEAPPRPGHDPRWDRLDHRPWVCRSCGEPHEGLFALASFAPAYWRGEEAYRPNRALGESDPFLSADFCVIEENRFIRAVLPLPLIGAEGRTFDYGVWTSLSQANFAAYVEHFDDDAWDTEDSWFGWFSNQLKGYPDTLNLKCSVRPMPGRRPELVLQESDHPLSLEQRDGVTYDRLMEIYALNGHAAALDA